MSVEQFQKVTQAAVTVPTAAPSTLAVTLARPTTKAAASNTVDFVAGNPPTEEDFLAGLVQVKLSSALAVADIQLLKLEKVTAAVDAAETPLFPNGSAAATSKVVYEDTTGIAGNDTELASLLNNLTVLAGESLKLTLKNGSGSDISGTIRAHYELGRNQADYSLRDEA